MNKSELIKKIQVLEQEVAEVSRYNKQVLEAQQLVKNELTHYRRTEEERMRNLKEGLMGQVLALRQEAAKLTTEYRQELCTLRTQWAETFLFNVNASAA
jgi:hypothetical protein